MIKKIAISIMAFAGVFVSPVIWAQTADDYTVEQASADPANWRQVNPEDLLIYKTTKGDVYIEIAPGFAPAHAEQIRRIVRSGLYAGTEFHRVISDFMAQGGDIAAILGREPQFDNIPGEFYFRRDPAEMQLTPINSEDAKKSQYTGYYKGFPVETAQDARADYSEDGKVESWMPHCPGVVSMARTNDPNSAKDQFFLMRSESEFLNRQYSSWGRMIKGLDIAKSLAVGEPPPRPDILVSTFVASDLGAQDQPRAWVMRTDGPLFQEFLDRNGRDESICDLPQVPAVVDIKES